MSSTPILKGGKRIRKAYWTATVVLFSYWRLYMARRIFGHAYFDNRIMALHIRNAERVKKAILELNGLFIKIGQMLSILSNFLPEAFQKPLEALQDQLPQRPIEEVRLRIRSELSKDPEQLFAHFDPQAIAAASIGQAHRARLFDGTEVVVKVQHYGIEEVAQIDLDIVKRLTAIVAWFYDIKGMDYLYSQLKKMIEEELDFRREVSAMQTIAHNLTDETGIAIPTPHPDFCAGRVMVTTWHAGVKIADTAQLDTWGLDRRQIAETLLRVYCRMIIKDGYYHADPHPGNILVKPDGTLVLLDFGAVGSLSDGMREGIPKLIECAIQNDTQGMIDACRLMGFIAEGREATQTAEKMITALRNFIQNEIKLDGLDFKNIEVNPFNNSLFSLLQDIGLSGISGTVQVPKDYVLLNRALTLLLGICHTLDPQLNPLTIVRPYVKQLVMGERGDWFSFARNFLQNTATGLLALPADIRGTLQSLRRGEIDFRTPDLRDGMKLLYLSARQWLMAALTIGGFGYAEFHPDYQFLRIPALLCAWIFWRAWREGSRIYARMK